MSETQQPWSHTYQGFLVTKLCLATVSGTTIFICTSPHKGNHFLHHKCVLSLVFAGLENIIKPKDNSTSSTVLTLYSLKIHLSLPYF